MQKITIITGVASGIGKELAIQLNAKGHKIIGFDIDIEGMKSLPNEMDKMQLDVTDYEKVKQNFLDVFQKSIIIEQVEANKEIIVFPFYGKLMWFLYRNFYPIFSLLNVKILNDFRKIREN